LGGALSETFEQIAIEEDCLLGVKAIDMDRAILAFLVAGFAVPILVAACFSIESTPTYRDYVLIIVVSVLISFCGILFLGVPAYSFLRARNLTAFWIAPLAGFIVATVAWYVFNLLLGLALTSGGLSIVLSRLFDRFPLDGVLWPAGPIGAFVGILVWLIARPDRLTTGGNTENNR
jgi:hypothetical protein